MPDLTADLTPNENINVAKNVNKYISLTRNLMHHTSECMIGAHMITIFLRGQKLKIGHI